MNKRIISILLCLLMVLSFPMAAAATAEEEPVQQEPVRQLTVTGPEQFLAFVENCRLDSYSENLEVTLGGDIDLTGTDFAGIPIFCGTLKGNGHTVSGISITGDGSNQGLFRYLTDTAVVTDLHVEGSVTPDGSRAAVGGIAGSNAGRIENCSFSGTVMGSDHIGGLVGINAVTGIIDGCSVEGSMTGNHFVGGLAGENNGVIRDCRSSAQVNTAVQDNSLDISDITLESITGSEAASTATDIGGIAGANTGVIRNCENRGEVGYRQMGYNIGGIAGSQSGYIAECENHGRIHGRKEVGGIVGQMEPATKIEYSVDTLQILEGQLNTLSGLAGNASASAQNNAANIGSQITNLEDHLENAKDAVETLIPDEESPEPPDADTILAAQNTLAESMAGMNTSINSIVTGLQGTISTLSRDMQAISGQIGAMGETLKGADENIGGTLTDVSDGDTDADTTGKVAHCANYGVIQADLNAGGIVGAMALENELDQEENLDILGDNSLNYTGQLRSVVADCENNGAVTAKKQNAGGIVGWQSLGLVKSCINTGSLDAANADYVGGIAGMSDGYIRACSAKSEVSGSSYVGGIAGSGSVVTDCRSMTLFRTVTEKMGEVLGDRRALYGEEETPVQGNYYLSIGKDWGAIDGISYAGCAEPVDRDGFIQLEMLPAEFKTVSVFFVIEEENWTHEIILDPGSALDPAHIPAVPEKTGFIGEWEGLAEADLDFVEFDTVFRARYTQQIRTLSSTQQRPSGQAILLAQGAYGEDEVLELKPQPSSAPVIEAWSFTLPASGQTHTLRYALPEGVQAEDVQMSVQDSLTGNYHSREFTANGSYIVFDITENDVAFCIREAPADYTWIYLAAGGAVAVMGVIITVAAVRRKKKKAFSEEQAE